MNDFISQEKQYEIINQVLEFLDSDKPINDISEYLEDEIRNINKNHKDIGLKDINGKSIYADSSIVKIEYLTKQWNKATGYFKYISSELGYCFQIGKTISIPIHKLIFKNIEIIDTIQENKLGLIK